MLRNYFRNKTENMHEVFLISDDIYLILCVYVFILMYMNALWYWYSHSTRDTPCSISPPTSLATGILAGVAHPKVPVSVVILLNLIRFVKHSEGKAFLIEIHPHESKTNTAFYLPT